MSTILDMLFEEDIEAQDALDDLIDFTDDSEDIILGAINDRISAKEESENHIFANEEPVNADGLTDAEERDLNLELLNSDENIDDLIDDDDMDF